MLRGEGHGGAAHGVVEPGMVGVGSSKESLKFEVGGNLREEVARPIEKGEEAVPVDC